jgi:hypothetical protein
MTDEPHEVVKLLLARMESHPEEFRVADAPFHDRWYDHINGVHAYGNEADKAAIAAKLRDIRLDEIHERVMDEMLNGEDRRRKHAEDTAYERHLAQAMQHTQQLRVGTLSGDMNPIGYASGGGGAGIPIANGGTVTAARYPTSTDMENNGIVSALRKLVS